MVSLTNSHPSSVCELLENRLKYDGKVVEVRAVERTRRREPH